MADSIDTKSASPYGSWSSPITADSIVAGSIRLGQPAIDGEDLYWIESRPSEGGRNVLVRRLMDGSIQDVTPSPWNVRTRVHEYGGGAYAVRDGIVVFSHDADGRLYRFDIRETETPPRPLTPAGELRALRYADIAFDAGRDRVLCVREDHTAGGEPVNGLVAVSLSADEAGDPGAVLAGGTDFVSSPALSPDGGHVAFLTWNHPNMPWDESQLWIGRLSPDGAVSVARRVAGGDGVSIFQPQWLPDGSLVYIADPDGWWNPFRIADPRTERPTSQPLRQVAAEFGLPQWVFGMSTTAVLGNGRIACAFNARGSWSLAILDATNGDFEHVDLPFDDIEGVRASGNLVVLIGGSPEEPTTVALLDVTSRNLTTIKRSTEAIPESSYVSAPQTIEFPTSRGKSAFGFFYAPANPDVRVPSDELPPLIVLSHGGPTGATDTTLNLEILYWTSRGIAVLDVNYGGSTGYGRAYRARLDGQWGVVDVDDCCNGARFLIERGLVDPRRLIIRGGSAGGFTTLAALTFRDVFTCGASRFGISDLETMATDTHKFESRYLDRLVGPYPAWRSLYVERSPIHHLAGLNSPMILLQGLEDKVVPPDQSEKMYDAVKSKGLPVAYVTFEGEQHGFRKAENIKRALEAELYFFGKVFGFEPADDIESLEIANL